MRLARAWSIALVGMEATLVEVEVSIGGGLPNTMIVGLGDTAVKEASQRCRSAVAAAGFAWPPSSVTVNLTPADMPKSGSHYDLPLVAATMAASGVVPRRALEATLFLGELGLDGRVRSVRGVLPAVLGASRSGFERAVVPLGQIREAQLVEGIGVVGVESLGHLVAVLKGEPYDVDVVDPAAGSDEVAGSKDLADVVGQPEARWALEVAAAGGHHVSMVGPPGVGKTLLAERLPGILPDLAVDEALEVSAIHSMLGASLEGGLIRRPPYTDPHHSASLPALVGGGPHLARPGAVSRAHRGVLFLDEASEFSPAALEALRTPLEKGVIVLARSQGAATYPARFQLVLASNPCPCGWYNVAGFASRCRCQPYAIKRYSSRLSGPIIDRIDIQLRLQPLSKSHLRGNHPTEETSAVVAQRVLEARSRQRHRLDRHGFSRNAEVPGSLLHRELPNPTGVEDVDAAVRRGVLSSRGVDKVLRLAWTIADLMGHGVPDRGDVHTALAMRQGETEEVNCA